MILFLVDQWGSGGREIGQRLAHRLELPFWDAAGGPHPGALHEDGVVVGDCPCAPVGEQRELIRVLIHCDMDTRIRRMMERFGLTYNQAAREAMQRDRECARRYGLDTGRKWTDSSEYHLTVHSGYLGIPGAVELLGQFVALHMMRKRRGLYDDREE